MAENSINVFVILHNLSYIPSLNEGLGEKGVVDFGKWISLLPLHLDVASVPSSRSSNYFQLSTFSLVDFEAKLEIGAELV